MITQRLVWTVIIAGSAILIFAWIILSARKEIKKGFGKKKK